MRIRHKGLRRFAAEGDAKGIDQAAAGKLARILAALSAAGTPADMAAAADFGGWRMHPLKGGAPRGHWSVRVNRNWRVTFRFVDGEAVDVDLIDYH